MPLTNANKARDLFRRIINWIGHLLAAAAIILLIYHQLAKEAYAVVLLLALGYIGKSVLTGKPIHLYPGSILFSISGFLFIKITAAPNAVLLFGLPLVLLLFGLGQFFDRSGKGDFGKPLKIAGHLSVFLLLGLVVSYGVTHLLIIISLAIYFVIYMTLFLLTKDRWYLLPGAIVLSFVYYFFLKGMPLIEPSQVQPFFSVIGPIYVALAFVLSKKEKKPLSLPVYSAAVILLLGITGMSIISHGFKTGTFVFLISGLTYGMMFLFTRRDEFIYLITLSMGLLIYNLIKISGDKFSLDLINIFLYGLIALSIFLLYPLLKRLLLSTKPFSFLIIRNLKGKIVYALPLAGVIVLILLLYVVENTKNPYFCATCHKTEPQFIQQYDNWKTSAHSKVSCVKCHYPPGLGGVVEGKIDGIRHLALFITKSYPPVLHARIEDRSCLTSHCHSKEALNEPVTIEANLKFNHDVHVNGEVWGMELVCTTCHAHTVEGEHFDLETSACFSCHFLGRDETGTAIGSCMSCHDMPENSTIFHDTEFNHTDFFSGKDAEDIDCQQCHTEVTRGEGDVPSQKCFSCHDTQFEGYDVGELHAHHLKNKKVDCFECHSQIEHGLKRKVNDLTPNCVACHRTNHSTSENIYVGTGGKDVEDLLSPMYLANVDCEGCHKYEKTTNHGTTGGLKIAGRQSCIDCHEDEFYGEVLDDWQKDTEKAMTDMNAALITVDRALRRAEGVVDGATFSEATKMYKRAKTNYDLVNNDGSFGAHNKEYADMLLEKAREDCQASLKLLEQQPSSIYRKTQ